MGSRMHIKLNDLFNAPFVTTEVYTPPQDEDEAEVIHQDPMVRVKFFDPTGQDLDTVQFTFTFDLCLHPTGNLVECDFNFFRYSTDDPRQVLLRQLYEHSICFSVVH